MDDRLPSGNLPVVTRTIGGHRYTVTRAGWWEAQDMIALLDDVLGPSLADAARSIKVDGGVPDITWPDLVAALPGALARASRRDGPGSELQKLLGERTFVEVEGRQVALMYEQMGIWFAQHPTDVTDWLLFALEVQVWDFFARPVSLLARRLASEPAVQAEGAAGSRSPST